MNKDEEIKIDLRKECELTSSETRGIDFLLGRHSRSVLMSLKKGLMMVMMTMMTMMMMTMMMMITLKKGLAPGGPDCVAPVFSWTETIFYNQIPATLVLSV